MLTALLDPLADARWARFVDRCEAASIFHHPAWLALLHRRYRYPVAAAVVLGDGGRPVAGLPLALVASRLTGRRLVSLPFSDACPPLVDPDTPPGALAALAGAVERERSARGVELQVRAPFPELGAGTDRFLWHLVDLSGGAAAAEARFARRVGRHVRKAERSGVVVERRTDRGALEAFYSLHLRTRRRLGVPTQPKGFILDLAELFAAGLGHVGLARLAGRPVAAAVFLRTGGTLTYKYGASDERFLDSRPNNLLFASVIRWACEEGLHTLDLGRTDLDQEGLAAFKRGWGAAERPLAYTYRGGSPRDDGSSRSRDAAAEVIRRGPPVLGRLVGELFYRHAG